MTWQLWMVLLALLYVLPFGGMWLLHWVERRRLNSAVARFDEVFTRKHGIDLHTTRAGFLGERR